MVCCHRSKKNIISECKKGYYLVFAIKKIGGGLKLNGVKLPCERALEPKVKLVLNLKFGSSAHCGT